MSIRPPLLKKGDQVAIAAPSRVIDKRQMKAAYTVFDSWGLKVTDGDHLYDKDGYFAGSDFHRLEDLQTFLDDPATRAIFCARGGYGLTRIIDQLDLKQFQDHPKWIVGFSDITALHLKLNQSAVESIHGLMPVQFGNDNVAQSIESLRKLLFDGNAQIEIPGYGLNRNGQAQGELVGGNLSLLVESLGTPTEIKTDNKILVLEEIDEYLYKIDRMMQQLKRAGKLKNLAGLIIGDFSQMKDTQIAFGKNVDLLLYEHIKDYNFPVAYNFPIGHENYNLAIPLGRKANLSVDSDNCFLKF